MPEPFDTASLMMWMRGPGNPDRRRVASIHPGNPARFQLSSITRGLPMIQAAIAHEVGAYNGANANLAIIYVPNDILGNQPPLSPDGARIAAAIQTAAEQRRYRP